MVRESHIDKHTQWELSIYPSLLSSFPLCFSYICYVRIFPTVSKNCRFHKCRGAKLFSEVVGACTLFVSSWNFVVTYCMKEDRGAKRQLAFCDSHLHHVFGSLGTKPLFSLYMVLVLVMTHVDTVWIANCVPFVSSSAACKYFLGCLYWCFFLLVFFSFFKGRPLMYICDILPTLAPWTNTIQRNGSGPLS